MRTLAFAVCISVAIIAGIIFRGVVFAPQSNPVPSTISTVSNAQAAVVRDFYDAVNEVFESGETEDLLRVMSRAFIDRVGGINQSGDRSGFVDGVMSIREVFPGYRVRCTAVETEEDHAVAHLISTGDRQGEFLGIPLEAPMFWSGVELLRIENGMVAERVWTEGTLRAYEKLADLSTPAIAGENQVVNVRTVNLSASLPTVSVYTPAPSLMVIEGGPVTLTLNTATGGMPVLHARVIDRNRAPREIDPGTAKILVARDLLWIPGGGSFKLTLESDAVAAQGLFVLFPQRRYDMIESTIDSISVSPVAALDLSTPRLEVPGEGATVRVRAGSLAVPAGEFLPSHQSRGTELILLSSGELEIELVEGELSLTKDGAISSTSVSTQTLESGLVLVSPESMVTYRNAGESNLHAWIFVFDVTGGG